MIVQNQGKATKVIQKKFETLFKQH